MTKIKVMALSDMHGMLPDLRDHPVDLVLIAGDIAPEYTDYNTDIAISWYTREFYRWCKSYVSAQKVFLSLDRMIMHSKISILCCGRHSTATR